MNKEYNFEHVKIRDTGSVLPLVFDIDDGYRRGGLGKTDEGDYVALSVFQIRNATNRQRITKYKKTKKLLQSMD